MWLGVCRVVTADGAGEAPGVDALSPAHDAEAVHLGLRTIRETARKQGSKECQQDAGCN